MSVRREDRRSALGRIVTAGAALVTGALAALVGLVAAPRTPAVTRRWRRAASMFDLPPDRPLMAVISERKEDGWYETREQTVVFLDKNDSGYRALSAVCSHLGCGVQWDMTAGQYKCPCHGGVYDRAGQVVSGPPPRPLDRLSVRVNEQTADIEVEL
jgi:Rieske Fe-S protein